MPAGAPGPYFVARLGVSTRRGGTPLRRHADAGMEPLQSGPTARTNATKVVAAGCTVLGFPLERADAGRWPSVPTPPGPCSTSARPAPPVARRAPPRARFELERLVTSEWQDSKLSHGAVFGGRADETASAGSCGGCPARRLPRAFDPVLRAPRGLRAPPALRARLVLPLGSVLPLGRDCSRERRDASRPTVVQAADRDRSVRRRPTRTASCRPSGSRLHHHPLRP